MQKIDFSVHEFMVIIGTLDERSSSLAKDSVYHAWKGRYNQLDRHLEELPMMERADMLFDGKVAFEGVGEAQLREVLAVVQAQEGFERKLIEDGDEDGDEDEVEVWQKLAKRVQALVDAESSQRR